MSEHGRKCPVCGRSAEEKAAERFRPFCSKRCADVDLGNWLKGSYGIPATEIDEDEDGDQGAGPASESEH